MNFKDFLNEETKYKFGEACDLEWGMFHTLIIQTLAGQQWKFETSTFKYNNKELFEAVKKKFKKYLDYELVNWVCSRRDVLCFTIDLTHEL